MQPLPPPPFLCLAALESTQYAAVFQLTAPPGLGAKTCVEVCPSCPLASESRAVFLNTACAAATLANTWQKVLRLPNALGDFVQLKNTLTGLCMSVDN